MDLFDLALMMTPGAGSVTVAHLIDSCFSAERVFAFSAEELIHLYGVSPKVANAIASKVAFGAAEQELRYCEQHEITPISRVDLEYPLPLRSIYNPPHILFVKGDKSLFTRNLISMVGTRDADDYGMLACSKIVDEIAKTIHNPVIVSGLAFGADSFAHRAALGSGVPTIAVLPSPLPTIMPAAHRDLSEQILRDGGALVSELTSKQTGAGKAYISRNRIIAGMSQGTILIESGESGGAAKTMEIVAEMQHQSMAIPGRLTDKYSKGCNRLISIGAATSVTSAEDVIRVLGWDDRRRIEQPDIDDTIDEIEQSVESSFVSSAVDDEFDLSLLNDLHRSFLMTMLSDDPIHVSVLERLNPMSAHLFNGLLVEMEIFGAIKSLPGSLYQRAVPMRVLNQKK